MCTRAWNLRGTWNLRKYVKYIINSIDFNNIYVTLNIVTLDIFFGSIHVSTPTPIRFWSARNYSLHRFNVVLEHVLWDET